MNVTVIGTGYVGLVTGACFSEFGVQVTCVDHVAEKIASLERGEIPIYEPGLDEIVRRNVQAGRLLFTTDGADAIANALVVFLAVGTPQADDGSTNLEYIESAARDIGRAIDGYKLVVTKSTVPVGTAARVRGWIQEELDARGVDTPFSIASNPEFLREGAAISDFMRPDRVVVGTDPDDGQALAIMQDLYRPLFLNETPFVLTNIPTAELAKYAGNAFLATKISFINEMALICEKVGGDVQAIARAMGLDRRIGPKFLHAGPGFGGSCFPKDTHSVAHFAGELGVEFKIAQAVIEVNARQRLAMIDKVVAALGGEVEGKRVGVLGLSFKPETDDMREAPAVDVVNALLERGAEVRAFDPHAMIEAEKVLPGVHLCKDSYEACKDADLLAIITEWNEFRALDLERVRTLMRSPTLVDMRNIYDPETMRNAGFEYWSVGR